ncbi:MAG: hypothetical protein IKE55_11745 [Kiritimatiellae bacterium]|nr:hypothetical protein [Kiritimatiellia bacterium]
MIKAETLMVVVAAITASAAAATYYVDDDNYGRAGLDGSTEALAYGTIQDAVDAAPSGSTVIVLPGTYDKGGVYCDGSTNRVFVDDKKLTIKSSEGREKTVIVGAKDPDTVDDPTKCGNGPNAERAFRIRNVSSDKTVLVEGFTVTGAAVAEPFSAKPANYGSVAYVTGSSERYACFVDCDFHHNSGSRGLLYGGTCVRCFIHDNFLPDGKGTATWYGWLLNCVVARNAQGAVVTGGRAVNCTIIDIGTLNGNVGKVGSESTKFFNCLAQYANGNGEGMSFDHCVLRFENSLSVNEVKDCIEHAERFQCVSPLTDDYRLRPSSQAVGFGDAAAIADVWVPEGVDRYLDFYGNPIPESGMIAAGAVQATAEPLSSSVLFDGLVTLKDGQNVYVGLNYAAATEYPVQWHVKPVLTAGQHLFGFHIDGVSNARRFPEMDDTLWLMPPPAAPAGYDIYCHVHKTSSAIYVDPTNGRDDSTGAGDVRGSADRPFATLQAAADLASAQSDIYAYAVIYAAEGVYDRGGKLAAGVSNRVAVSSQVRIKGAGADRTVIKGHLDVESPASERAADGRGPAAMRCAFLDGNGSAIQGFTLTEGRCLYDDGNGGHTGNSNRTWGGGVYAYGSLDELTPGGKGFVLDCVITNCLAIRGASVGNCNVFRSLITDIAYGQCRYSYFHSCVFRNVSIEGRTDLEYSQEAVIGSGCVVVQSNDFGLPTLGCYYGSTGNALNCISKYGNLVSANTSKYWRGCLAFGYSSYAGSGYVQADPEYVDEANADYEVHGSSPAFDCTTLPDDYWKTYCSDFNSMPLVFVNGRPLAGAFHTPLADRAAFVVSQSSAKGNAQPTGLQVVPAGGSLTVTASDTTRRFLGFAVNGSEPVATNSLFLCAPEGAMPLGQTKVEAVYSTNWYVNANVDADKGVVGDDANDGFTPETPKRTLEKIMEVDLDAGDVVHAAPGVYDQGSMTAKYAVFGDNGDSITPVRVCVDGGIALVGDEGAEKTVIKGEWAPTSNEIPYGGGSPMRCANVAAGGRIVGFTLTGGSTPYASNSGESVQYNGGGVLAPWAGRTSSGVPLVQDCIISNNWAGRGGGAMGGVFKNCMFVNNYSKEDGNANYRSQMENCLISMNHGKSDSACVVRFPYGMANVTMAEDNITDSTGQPTKYFIYDYDTYKSGIYNSIVMGGSGNSSRMAATNCLFVSGITHASEGLWGSCEKVTTEALKFDASCRPAVDSPAVDAGANAFVLSPTDLAGGQRIYNGTVDIGCYEYDWRGDYAAAIGGGVKVERASEGVTLLAGAVHVPDGGIVAGSWPAPRARARYTIPLSASDGTLAGRLVNEEAGFERDVSATDGSVTDVFKLQDTALGFTFVFSGTGEGVLSGFDQSVPGFRLVIP